MLASTPTFASAFASVGGAKLRKHLSADALYALIRSAFEKVPDQRRQATTMIPLADALMNSSRRSGS